MPKAAPRLVAVRRIAAEMLRRFASLLALILFVAAPPSVRLAAQSFTPGSDTVEITFFHGESKIAERTLTLASSDPKFASAALKLKSSQAWLRASAGAKNGSVRLLIDPQPSAYYSDSSATLTISTPTQSSTVAIRRFRLNDIGDVFSDAREVLHHPTLPLFYIAGSTHLLAVDAHTNEIRAWVKNDYSYSQSDIALSPDGKKLFLLRSTGYPTLQTLDSQTLRLQSEKSLSIYLADSHFAMEAGPEGVLYLVVPSGIHVLAASDLKELQFLGEYENASSHYTRFGSAAVDPLRKNLWVRLDRSAPRYYSESWSPAPATLVRYDIAPDGTLGAAVESPPTHRPHYPATPIYSPEPTVSISADGSVVACDDAVVSPASDGQTLGSTLLPERILGLATDGELALTERGLVALPEGELLLELKPRRQRFLFTPDDERLLYTATSASSWGGRLDVVDLPALLNASVLGRRGTPADGAFVQTPSRLSWRALTPSSRHRVYLGSDAAALDAVSPAATLLLGETDSTSFAVDDVTFSPGATYFWRVDSLVGERTLRGAIRSFTIADAAPSITTLSASCVAGARRSTLPFAISSGADAAWTLSADVPWLAFEPAAGSGNTTVRAIFSAAALPPGAHSATATLVAGGRTLSVPVSLTVDPPAITVLRDHPGAARAYALSEVTNSGRTHLLELDAADGSILRSVPAGRSATDLALHLAEQNLYVANFSEGKIRAFSLADLSPRAVLDQDLPSPDSNESRGAARVFPGLPGRLLVETAFPSASAGYGYYRLSLLSLIDSSTGAVLASATVAAGAGAVVDQDAGLLYRRGQVGIGYARSSSSLRSFTLATDRIGTARAEVDDQRSIYAPILVTPAPQSRIYSSLSSYDADLLAGETLDDPVLGLSADGSVRVSGHLAYVNGTAKRLPDAKFHVFNRSSGRILSASPSSGVICSDPAGLPDMPPLSVVHAEATDRLLTVRWSDPGYTLPYGASVEFQTRVLGTETWVGRSSAVYSNPPLTFSTDYLAPETTYEFRLRQRDESGSFTPWSEPRTIGTAIARPSYGPDSTYYYSMSTTMGSPVSIVVDFTGKDLNYEIEGLPPGLSYSEDTQTLSGVCEVPGRYWIQITATNVSGSYVQNFNLVVRTDRASLSRARYSGLLINDDSGPLAGRWSALRERNVVTGVYHSMLFSRAFLVPLKNESGWDGAGAYGKTRYGTAWTDYEGVSIRIEVIWDISVDRLSVSAETWNLVENFVATTDRDTGLAGHWAKATQPHPHAARYTAILHPEDGRGTPRPDGNGFFLWDLNADGLAAFRGETSLGQKITQSGHLSDWHSIPFAYRSGITVAFGGLALEERDGLPPFLGGELVWAKNSAPAAGSYRGGFEQQLAVIGAQLPKTGKNLPPLAPLSNPAGRATLRLYGGGLSRLSKPIAQDIVPTAAGLSAAKPGTPENRRRVNIALAPATGIVTGDAALFDDKGVKVLRTLPYRGILVRDPLGDGEDLVAGYFLFPDGKGRVESGALEISEAPSEDAPEVAP